VVGPSVGAAGPCGGSPFARFAGRRVVRFAGTWRRLRQRLGLMCAVCGVVGFQSLAVLVVRCRSEVAWFGSAAASACGLRLGAVQVSVVLLPFAVSAWVERCVGLLPRVGLLRRLLVRSDLWFFCQVFCGYRSSWRAAFCRIWCPDPFSFAGR